MRTSGPVLSNKKPSLVQVTLQTELPDELQVREKFNLTSMESWDDVNRKLTS